MRLPDPFVDTVAPGFSEAILNEIDPIIKDAMSDGRVLKVSTAAQYWTLSLTYPDLTPDEFAYLYGFLANTKRLKESIDVLLPQYETFTVTGEPDRVSIAPGQQGNTITITNAQHLDGRPRLNSLFKLSNSSKVYKITSIDINETGDRWVLGLYPDLVKATAADTLPIFNTVLFEMTLEDDVLPEENPSVEDGLYRGVVINLREDIVNG